VGAYRSDHLGRHPGNQRAVVTRDAPMSFSIRVGRNV
jgi:hypothetical protein